jgi:SAM-dependent methyltransferase
VTPAGPNAIERAHSRFVFSRRVRVLAEHLARRVAPSARVVDVGCGDGRVGAALTRLRPDISIRGFEVLPREATRIPVEPFDGRRLPLESGAADTVLLIDVVHHALHPDELLAEAARVAGTQLVVKDHRCDRFLARPLLRFMDRIGNARHGVALPYDYWKKERWERAFDAVGLEVVDWDSKLKLYPVPADFLFGGSLQFIAVLRSRPI